MNIFDILKEAKSPSKPENKTLRISTNNDVDYTEEVSDNNDPVEIDATGNDDSDSTDYTEEVEEIEPEESDNTNDEENTEEDEPTDYTDNLDSDEEDDTDDTEGTDDSGDTTDYTEELDDGGSGEEDSEDGEQDNSSDDTTQEEESPEDQLESKQNLALLNSLTDLYYSIIDTCNKLDTVTYHSVISNKINIQVKQNLSKLTDYVYTFITSQFNSNSYVKNLYIYNYIIESYKINIEMLKKINELE